MQIILNKDEVQTVYEALLTERNEVMREYALEKRKGRGEFEAKYLSKIDKLIDRLKPCMLAEA